MTTKNLSGIFLKIVMDDEDFMLKGRPFQNEIAAKQEVFLP